MLYPRRNTALSRLGCRQMMVQSELLLKKHPPQAQGPAGGELILGSTVFTGLGGGNHILDMTGGLRRGYHRTP